MLEENFNLEIKVNEILAYLNENFTLSEEILSIEFKL